MRRRLANWFVDRECDDRWVPSRAFVWAFDYLMARGTPVVFGVRSTPLLEVNPAPKTWATGSSTVITFPPSPDNPLRLGGTE